ncbi:MAG TPA: hypothetical protein VLA61_26340 [Ideonella sp.]|uniref:hypothetical protein n=1 Tax=Ideonella sp. TaxID=1929293 RepID=UPI002B869E98|nr:hypothetical protein [Ideonella sp.]HSI51803.1 hypothetical protein [Ideonella sp.]
MGNAATKTKHPEQPRADKAKAPGPQRGPETESDAGEEDPGAALDMPGTREAMAPGLPQQEKGDALGGGRK